MKIQRNVLKGPQRFQLISWFNKNQAEITEKRYTQAECARRATEALGFRVTAGNLQFAGTSDAAFIEHAWPKMQGGSKVQSAQVALLVRMVQELMADLGVEAPPQLRSEWEALVEESQ